MAELPIGELAMKLLEPQLLSDAKRFVTHEGYNPESRL